MSETQNKKYTWGQFLKDYWMLLEGRRKRFIFFTLMRMLVQIAPFIIAYLLGKIVDFLTGHQTGESLFLLYVFSLGISLTGMLHVVLRFYTKVRMQTIAARIRKEVRVKAMEKLIDLELSWHEKEESGSKLEKINQGGEMIYHGTRLLSNEGMYIIVSLISALSIFFFIDLHYLLFSVACVAVYFYGEYWFNKRIDYWQTELNKIKEKVSGKFHESTSNLLTVKALGLKGNFAEKTAEYEKKFYETWVKTRDATQTKTKTLKSFIAIMYGLFILWVGLDTINGSITVGLVLTYSMYFEKLKRALQEITDHSKEFITVKTSIGRFMTIFGIETREEEGKIDVPKDWKSIVLKNVSFKYKERYVLKNFNLEIKRNQKIGLVGKTGSGKSTIIKLLLGLYEPCEGAIEIDGILLSKFKRGSLREMTNVVLQDAEMFNSTLLENISIAVSGKTSRKKIEKAVSISELEGLVEKLPQGIHTLIGERGYKLSGGERQRVSLARAVFKDSPFLILDEATSSLDSKTEANIQRNIEKALKDKTLLIIAHRLSTLRNVEKIIVLEKGKIVEEGSYKVLLGKKGLFYRLHSLQQKKEKGKRK